MDPEVQKPNGNGAPSQLATFAASLNDKEMRALGVLLDRQLFMRMAGLQFDGRRDLYDIFGYDRIITAQQYRDEYARGGIAKRIVECFPKATWRGGIDLYEDEDPDVETEFEKVWKKLEKKHGIWNALQNVDILAGLSTYSVLLIGAPGKLEEELPKGNPDKLLYLQPFFGGGGPGDQGRSASTRTQANDTDVMIESFDVDPESRRFGDPLTYRIRRTDLASPMIARPVHWSRVIHVCEGALDNRVYGVPTLESVWNLLMDLEKITGGGSESFFQRAKHTLNVNIQKDAQFGQEDITALKAKLEEYQHNLTNIIPTREVDVKLIEAAVANFSNPVDTILKQIAGSKGIPMRILTGSEMGTLASEQDAENFDSQVHDRRTGHAEPNIARRLFDRLIEYGYLPTPEQYEVGWPVKESMDEIGKADLALKMTQVNKESQGVVFTFPEVRERSFGLKPLKDMASTDLLSESQKADIAYKLAQTNKAMGITVFTDDEIRKVTYGFDPLSDEEKVPIGAPERISVTAPPPLGEDGKPIPQIGPDGKPITTPALAAVPAAAPAKPKSPVLKAATLSRTLKALEAAIEADDLQAIGKILDLQQYKYGSTQVQLPPDVAEKLFAVGRSIPDADIYEPEGGRETDAHVTVKYGLLEPDADRLAAVVVRHSMSLGKMGRISLTLGDTNIFATPDYDVVYAEVHSPDLIGVNRAIATRLPTESTHAVYIPHATIAYVKPGTGKKYIGLTSLSGIPVIVDSIVLIDVDGVKTEISLMGHGAKRV